MRHLANPVFSSLDSPDEHQQKIRERLVDRIWTGLFLIAVVGMPLSVLRFVATGWLPLYTFHIGLAVVAIFIYLRRERLSFRAKAITMMAMFYAVGTAGMFNLGMMGAGVWWLALSSLLASTVYSLRAGVIASAITIVLILAAAAAFIGGWVVLPVDANKYLVTPSSWATLLIASTIMPYIVFHSVSVYQYANHELMKQIHAQQEQLTRFATQDQLTGLLRLNMASDRLQVAIAQARRSGRKVGLLFIDLDGFKAINDDHGHEAGDAVLKAVADRLLGVLRDVDAAARIGGDEFLLVLCNLDSDQEAAQIAERIIAEVSRPFFYAGQNLQVGASIGIALFPEHAGDADSLRRVADLAMYRVKRSGKNNFAFAEPALTV